MFDSAAVLGLLGVNIYLLLLESRINAKHQTLKIFLMLTSFLSVLLTLGFVSEIVQSDPLANANMLSLTDTAYSVYVWLTMGFIAYWVLFLFYEMSLVWRKVAK